MDLLRGISVSLIALWHASLIPGGGSMPVAAEVINNALSPYRVPMLLVLSGMLLRRSLSKGLVRYYEGKLRRIVWPLVLWIVIYLLIPGGNIDWQHDEAWLMDSYLWFLVVMVFSFAIGPLVRIVPEVVVVLGLLVAHRLVDPANPYGRVLWFATYFFIGSAVGRLPRWRDVHPAVIAAAGLFAIGWGTWVAHRYLYAPIGDWWLIVLGLPGVMFALWVAPRIPRTRVTRVLEIAGENSLVVYLVHFPVMLLVFRSLEAIGITSPWVTFPAILAGSVAVVILAIRHRARVEFLFTAPRFDSLRLPSR